MYMYVRVFLVFNQGPKNIQAAFGQPLKHRYTRKNHHLAMVTSTKRLMVSNRPALHTFARNAGLTNIRANTYTYSFVGIFAFFQTTTRRQSSWHYVVAKSARSANNG